MKELLGGAIVGLFIAGIAAGAIVPMLPSSARQPWVVWTAAAVVVAASMYLARRLTKTPPG